YLERVKKIDDETRRKYAALVAGMDDAIGVVLEALRASGQENDTLIWFFSDNGGPVLVTHSSNLPLRGAKGSIFEGGVRVPFLIAWPGRLPAGGQASRLSYVGQAARLPAGKDYPEPVSSLDVFATSAAL